MQIFSKYILYICVFMSVYLYIHNKYTQYTHIYYVNKNFILDTMNRLTALVFTQYYPLLTLLPAFYPLLCLLNIIALGLL